MATKKIDRNDPIYADIINGTAGQKLLDSIGKNSNSGMQAYSQITGTVGPAESINRNDPAYAAIVNGTAASNLANSISKTSSTKSSSSSSQSGTPYNNNANWLASYNSTKPTYTQSAAVQNAANQLAAAEAAKPAPYQESWAVRNAANQLANIEASQPGPYRQSQSVIDAANLLAQYEANRPGDYRESQAVTDALNALTYHEANRPDEYQSSYADQIQNILDQIMNREKFTYDFNSDPMYQMYADQYQQKGQMAMMDTMGQAAALTGGYGNTYAQSVGQQAYNAYLQELNNIIPELRDAAYQMYQAEGTDMYNKIGLLQGLEESDYARYRDTISDYLLDRDYLYGKYADNRNFDYGQYRDDVSDYYTDRDYYYGKYADDRNFDYAKYRDTMDDWFTNRGYYYGKYFDLSEQDYGRYRDTVGDYQTDRNYYYNKYTDVNADDYNRYLNELASWQADRDIGYQAMQDDQSMAYQMEKDARAQANYEQEMAWQKEQYERETAYQAEKDRLAREAAAQEMIYQQYLDAMDQYNKDRDYNRGLANDAADMALNRYNMMQDQANWEREQYLQEQKAIADGVNLNSFAGAREPDQAYLDSILSGVLYPDSVALNRPSYGQPNGNPYSYDEDGNAVSIYVEGLGDLDPAQFAEGIRTGQISWWVNADGDRVYYKAR